MKKKAQLARPSNLPGKRLVNRKTKIGACVSCGARGRLILELCRRCYSRERYRAMHPGSQPANKGKGRGRPRRGSPSWLADWLKRQAENYLRENARHFDRNGFRLWAMTEDQVIDLCRIIYMAVNEHQGGRHMLGVYRRQRKAWWDQEEGDGSYLDRSISPELRGLAK